LEKDFLYLITFYFKMYPEILFVQSININGTQF